MGHSLSDDERPKVVVADRLEELLPYADLRNAITEAGGELELLDCRSATDVIAQCADAVAIVVHWIQFDRALLSALPNCHLLVRFGIGYDVIDVDAARDLGIIVCNTPFFCTEEVADHAMALLLAVARKLKPLAINATMGRWDRDDTGALDRRSIRRLRGRTLGLVGYGRIARALAVRARAFGLRILAYDPYIDWSSLDPTEVTGAELDEVLAAADYVSLHVPLNDETRGLIDAAKLQLMKPTAILINASRGQVIDESALITALREGRIAGAGLDVLAQEPPDAANPLLHMENVVVTPHYGAASAEAIVQQMAEAAESIVAVLRGEWPPYVVNRGVIPRQRMAAARGDV
jgi:D-3-phosphoglycerate dehydrogenase